MGGRRIEGVYSDWPQRSRDGVPALPKDPPGLSRVKLDGGLLL